MIETLTELGYEAYDAHWVHSFFEIGVRVASPNTRENEKLDRELREASLKMNTIIRAGNKKVIDSIIEYGRVGLTYKDINIGGLFELPPENVKFTVNGLPYYVHHGLPHAASKIRYERRAGNSTRIVNDTIELMYELGHVGFKDHAQVGEAQEHTRKMLFKRLDSEFRGVVWLHRGDHSMDMYRAKMKPGTPYILVGKNFIKYVLIRKDGSTTNIPE